MAHAQMILRACCKAQGHASDIVDYAVMGVARLRIGKLHQVDVDHSHDYAPTSEIPSS